MALTHFFVTATNKETGRPLDGVIVELLVAGVPQTLYSDRSFTPKPQMLTGLGFDPITGVNLYPDQGFGEANCYVEEGNYDIRYTYNGEVIDNQPDFPVFGSLSSVTFIASGAGATSRTVQSKLREHISITDFGAVCDGVTDDTAAVQLAVNACLADAVPRDLMIPGPTRLASPVMIDRLVGDTDNYEFRIFGNGPGAGFHTTGDVVMFDSTLTVTTAPQSQQVIFDNIRFSSSSVFNTSYVITKKFLRMRFNDCLFWLVRCVDSDIYLQTWYWNRCTIRNWPGYFIKCAGSFDMSVGNCVIENGTKFMRSADAVRGTLGLRIFDNVIEGNTGATLECNGAFGVNIHNNHIEGNGGPADYDFSITGPSNGNVSVIGNMSINPGGPVFLWGATNTVISLGNSCGSPNPGTGTVLHSGLAFVTNPLIMDMATTESDSALPMRFGNLKGNGALKLGNVTVPYSADMFPDGTNSNNILITATNGTAFIVRAVVNAVSGASYTIKIKNTSGGALGAITWSGYKLAAWTSPATGFSRSITFFYDGTDFIETSRTPADVPN